MSEPTPRPKPDVERLPSTPAIGSGGVHDETELASRFQTYMQNVPSPTAPHGPTPMELVGHPPVGATQPTLDTLLTQAKLATITLGDVQTQLQTPNLKLKQSQKYLLKNKLSDASNHLRSANAKMGAPIPDEPEEDSSQGPLSRFMALLTDGQNQLDSAQAYIKKMNESGTSLSAGDMLLLQVKMNKAQQELEYASVLLGKAMDDIKTLFNVQL